MVTGIGNALLIPALSTIYLGATAEQNRSQVMGIQCFNGSAWLLHLKTTCPSNWLHLPANLLKNGRA